MGVFIPIPNPPLDETQRAALLADLYAARLDNLPNDEDTQNAWGCISALTYFIVNPLGSAPTFADKSLVALATAADGDAVFDGTIAHTPAGYVRVFVKGVAIHTSDGDKTGEAYWSMDGGLTAANLAELAGGFATLYWNGSIAEYELEAGWRVSLDYVAVPS